MPTTDVSFMQAALQEAEKAQQAGEVPVGCVVVHDNTIIARAYNQVEQRKTATAHAEMIALAAACSYLGSKYLPTCTLYVTLEPCGMCSSATYWVQLGRLVFGASDPKRGYQLLTPCPLHPRTQLQAHVLATESQQLLRHFFKTLRSTILEPIV